MNRRLQSSDRHVFVGEVEAVRPFTNQIMQLPHIIVCNSKSFKNIKIYMYFESKLK